MWPVLTRTLRARPLRALLTALAVALGVAAVLAVQVTLTALDRQAGDVAGRRAGRSDLDVRAVAGAGLDAAQLARLRATAGVAEVQPLYEKRIAARTARDQLDSVQVTLVGVTAGEAALRPVVVTQGGLPSQASNGHEVALDADVAEALGARSGHRLRVGEQVYLTTATGPQAFTLSGITAGTGAGPGFTRSAAFVSLAEATGPFALGLHAPLAALRLDPATAPAAVATRVRATLGPVAATAD
ncbi:MAG TPA: ABC transporter permease, partial [Candidatus Dormibacteraeota bacterium]